MIAHIAFPDGSMGESGLKREAARGNLATETIAGKTYTTLNDIKDMRVKCRENRKDHASTFAAEKGGPQYGSSSILDIKKLALDAAARTAMALKNSSRFT